MAIALEAKGTMRLEQVMQPAIELADGFPMYDVPARFPRSASARRPSSTSGRRRPTIPTAGSRRSARCSGSRTSRARCRAIAAADKAAFAKTHDRGPAIRAGRDAFYTGDIARRIADADQAAGGVFTYDDLANVPRHDREAGDDDVPRLRRSTRRARGTRARCCCRR